MQTLVIVRTDEILFEKDKDKFRKKLIREMQEGLIVIDNNIEISTLSISGAIGLMFNIDEEEENEKSNVA